MPKNRLCHLFDVLRSGYYDRLKRIKGYKLKCSMSGKGNCYDNAVCESFFHTLKVEQVYRQSFQTVEEAGAFWYIEGYYNLRRSILVWVIKVRRSLKKMQPKSALFTGSTGLNREIENVSKNGLWSL